MAVLTRPLFHSQERIDLEDLNQLLSGLRTDARLWTRQVYADQNYIIKGFDVSGLGTDSLSVNLLDSTLLFAGRQDLTGSAAISVTGVVAAGTVITLNNSTSSNTVTLTEGVDWDKDDTNTAQTAANLAAAIDGNGNFSASASGAEISISALNVDFTTITASDATGFSNEGGTLSTFVYPTDLQESPADLSYFIIQSDASGADARISRAISASERASVGTASKTLFVYGTLVTEQNTPITKAFWDPSANSGAGAEFNQRVNTAVDLAINLLVSESKLNTDTEANAETFFANVPICEVEVDTSGIILSIRDTRPILFEADDNREWNRTNAFATITTTETAPSTISITNGLVPNSNTFAEGEIIDFFSLDADNIIASAVIQDGGTLDVGAAEILLDKFDLSTIGAFKSLIRGRTSNGIRVITMIDSNFFRDDKDIGDWKNAFNALATEIKNVKGSQRWYDDPSATVKDVLRFVNSTIVGLEPDARYSWTASGTSTGSLSLALDPLSTIDLTVVPANNIPSGSTLTFSGGIEDSIVITATDTAPTGVAGSADDLTFTLSSGTDPDQGDLPFTFTLNNFNNQLIQFNGVVPAPPSGNTRTLLTLPGEVRDVLNATEAFSSDYTATANLGAGTMTITANATGSNFNTATGGLEINFDASVNINNQVSEITGGVDGIGPKVFLIGTDSEATASHLASSINFNDGLSATFAESGTTPGAYIVTVGRSTTEIDRFDYSAMLGIIPFNADFPAAGNTDALANIRLYGIDNSFTFPAVDLSIDVNEVLFVTLPDLNADSISDVTFNGDDFGGNQFSYVTSGPDGVDVDMETGRQRWNSTNKAIFEGSNDVFKTVPIADFECNNRNYWIAFRDESETIYIRDVGELGTGESANIGHGISNATLSYIGAPSENDSTPFYPAVDTINSFVGNGGAYLATASPDDYNKTLVAQSENLTSAINDLNNHLTSIKDTQYQNLGLKLIDGGFFTWETDTNAPTPSTQGTLSWSEVAYISVPGLPNTDNAIAAGSIVLTGDAGSPDQWQIAFVDINREETGGSTLTVQAASIDAFEPQRDRIVIARKVGDFVYLGIAGSIRLADSESAPLDSALQYIGLIDNQLPKQLNTHISAAVTNLAVQSVDVGTSDISFPVGGLSTFGTFDDSITLSLSINSGVLFWEGATFDLIAGRIYNEGSNPLVNFRGRDQSDSSFVAGDPGTDMDVWYAISLTGETTITEDNRSTLANPAILAEFIGRKAGEPTIDRGIPAATGMAIPPEFTGDLPVGLIRVSNVAGALSVLDASDLIILGASGSGGGGTGDANQDLNNYLNRLNLSTFEYLTPLIAAVSTIDNIDLSNTTAGLAASGFTLEADQRFVTTTLLDPEFTQDGLIPDRVEIESIFGVNSEGANIIDPNARYFISFNSADGVPTVNSGLISANGFTPVSEALSKTVAGWIDSGGVLRGTNLTGDTDSNIIFVENHELSTGQKINFPTGSGTLNPAVPSGETLSNGSVFYVHVISQDSFDLHPTQLGADSADTNDRLVLSGTTFGSVILNRDQGAIDRVGVTNTLHGTFDTRLVTLNGLAYTNTDGSIRAGAELRIAIFGDTDADIRNQSNDALMTSLALFYADELGVEGVNPNGLDDVNDILRSSHLVNSTNANASYGVAGRGVTLLNGAGTNTEIALDTNNNITIDGTAPIETNGATDDQILRFNGTNFVPVDAEAAAGTVPSAVAQFVTAVSPNTEGRLGGTGRSTIFSYTEATWVCPAGVSAIFVEMGGGGSSRNTAVSSGGTNGSAGAWYQGWHSVVPGETYNLRLGNPGAGSTTTGVGQNGGITRISGTLNAISNVIIDCSGGLAPEGPGTGSSGSRGSVSFTNINVGETRNDVNTNYPTARDFSIDTNPAAENWNKDGVWVTNAATGNAGRGGSTVRGLGGAFIGSEGGGGAGFNAGRDANVMSGRGGEGGIRITYFSDTASTIVIGNNVING